MALGQSARARLDEAAEALVEDWRAFSVDAVSQSEVAASVAEVVSCIASEANAVSLVNDDAPVLQSPTTPLSRRVIALLRRNLIHDGGSVAPPEFVDLLRAVERLAERDEPRWSDRFQDRMAGPSGLDLIVEVAHDLRSPLTSILFLAETMLRGRSGPLTPLQERQLGLVYSAAFGLNAVASDVIELVRGGDRLVSHQLQPFSIAEVLESVRDIVTPIAEEKGLTLDFDGPARDLRMGHPGALNRVLLNLTTNALKFTSEGVVEVRATDAGGDLVDCTVRDTGRGIPSAAMSMLYEPFRRRQRAGDYAFSGSGLGLSICRKLVEGMGSDLEVETVQGSGTVFSFRLSLPDAGPDLVVG